MMDMISGRFVLDVAWLIFLLLMFYHFWQSRKVLIQAQSWLKVKGHISQCEWTRMGHSLWPKIEYSYQVNEKDLVGHYLFLDTLHNNPNSQYSRQLAYKVALAFKEQTEVDIYYNPNQPEQSVLDVTVPRKLNFILVFIVLLMALHFGTILAQFWR